MFRHIPPDELPGVWEFVCRGLEKVRKRTKEPWNTDDVYRCLRGNRASLYLRDEGFVILSRREEEWSLEPYLLVWIAWFRPQSALQIQEELFDWLDAQKAQSGCRSIRILSPRLGWGKRLKGRYAVRSIIWERK